VAQDVDAVRAALAHLRVVLKRLHGQDGQYKAEPDAILITRSAVSTLNRSRWCIRAGLE
jgi:hypothetical protein